MKTLISSFIEAYLLTTLLLYFSTLLINHLLTAYYLHTYPKLLSKDIFTPRVSIIKPVKGLDQGAFENFTSFCELKYPNEYEVVFCAEDEDDPAIPTIEEVMMNHPDVSARLTISERAPDWMGKAANMIKGVQEGKYEILVFSDTDVRVDQNFLARLVRPLANPEIGLVFGCPAYREPRNLPAAFLAMSLDHFFLGLVLTALAQHRIRGTEFAVGNTMAIRRSTLSEIGGLEPFVSKITVDVPLARAVCAHGYRIHLLNEPVQIIHYCQTLSGWWTQLLRYMIMIRHYVPLAYVIGSIRILSMFHATAYFALSLLTGASLVLPGALLFGVIICRIVSSLVINATIIHDKAIRRYLIALPLLDLLRAPLWLLGLIRKEVAWRGMRYKILPDDTAVRLPEESS